MSTLNTFTQGDLDHAVSLFFGGQIEKAFTLAKKLDLKHPKNAHILHIIGLCVSERKGLAAGVVWLKEACRHNASAIVWHDLGVMLAASNQLLDAFDALSRAAALEPNTIDSLLSMASLMRQMGRESEAQPFYQIALNNAPTDPRAHLGMATTLHFMRDTEAAEPFYQSALSLSDSSNDVCWEYAMQNLLLGDFKQGWQNYDSRLSKPISVTGIYPFSQPLWQGQSLKGKTLLIHGEQGFGDEIMYASIIPELIDQAKNVIIATAPALLDLFQHSFPNATVHPLPRGQNIGSGGIIKVDKPATQPPEWLASYSKIHFQTPIGSLPRWRRNTAADFAKPKAYINAHSDRVQRFKTIVDDQLAKAPNLKIGLVWQGNLQTGLMGQRKSLPLDAFLPLATLANVRFISLQLEEENRQINAVPSLRVQPFDKHIKDFSDTAALIANLDLVITVDTGVAHLAAAMGKETWVLLWRAADWRYGHKTEHCLWYQNMHLFHQTTEGQWAQVIEKIEQRLTSKISSRD